MNDYTIDANGRIVNPGKFEGEPLYVVHFYELSLDGGSDETVYQNDIHTSVFNLTAEDVAKFPGLAGHVAIAIWECSQGFVYNHLFDTADSLATFRAECENSQTDCEHGYPAGQCKGCDPDGGA